MDDLRADNAVISPVPFLRCFFIFVVVVAVVIVTIAVVDFMYVLLS